MFRSLVYKVFPVLMLFSLLAACSEESSEGEEEKKELGDEENSLWLVDWDYENGLDIAKEASEYIDNLILLGTYFDEDAYLFYPENTHKLIEAVKENKDLS